jgi:hypothetical protein
MGNRKGISYKGSIVLKDSEVKETIVVFGTTNSLELVVEGRKK